MNEKSHFLKALLKNPLGVGAVTPSSKKLAELMVAGIEPGHDALLLELGVGTGALTSAISDILPDASCYLGIEIDEKLVGFVREKFPDLNILTADACTASDLHLKLALGNVRYILSGIPFVSLPKKVCENILCEVDAFMDKGSLFRTFQYIHGFYTPPAIRLRERMNRRYGPVETSPVVLNNLPPAITLTWKTL
ncbi:MAG: hypothetical protein OEM82_09055 [Acidobacteriota bacterium]|nr:hypothetical protein [Acidobacteriota bacterium]MDH3528623.1 hypothetical protein [Acidobacteriota bacterium]